MTTLATKEWGNLGYVILNINFTYRSDEKPATKLLITKQKVFYWRIVLMEFDYI